MRLFGKKTISEIEAAGTFVVMVADAVRLNQTEIAGELRSMRQAVDTVSDDVFAGEFLLAVIAAHIQALPNLLPDDQASRLQELVIQSIPFPDLESYPREIIQRYQFAWDEALEREESPLDGISSVLYDQLNFQSHVYIGVEQIKNPLVLIELSEKVVTFVGPWWKNVVKKYKLRP